MGASPGTWGLVLVHRGPSPGTGSQSWYMVASSGTQGAQSRYMGASPDKWGPVRVQRGPVPVHGGQPEHGGLSWYKGGQSLYKGANPGTGGKYRYKEQVPVQRTGPGTWGPVLVQGAGPGKVGQSWFYRGQFR